MEYKALHEIKPTLSVNDEDLLLISIFDKDIYWSRSVKWADIKDSFANQLSGKTDSWFMVPNLSSGNAWVSRLSVQDGFTLGEGALSGQVSVGIRYVPGDGTRAGGSGAMVLRNADGSISSTVELNDVLSGVADARPLSSVSISPDNKYVVFQLQSEHVVDWGETRGRLPLGSPISADNFLYRYSDGLSVLTADGQTPSVALDWPAIYRSFASNSAVPFAVPQLSAASISAYDGVISGAMLDSVSAVSLSAGGYDVGDTLCSLVSGLSAANDKIRRTLSTHVASFTLGYGVVSALSDILSTETLSGIEWEDGDVLVVRKKVCEDPFVGSPYQHTAYVYAGPEANPDWHAMDGTYSADSVVFGEDIELAGAYTSVGNVQISDEILNAKGKTVKALFDEIFDKTIQPDPDPVPPSITGFKITTTSSEVGYQGYVYYQLTFNHGQYKCPWDGSRAVAASDAVLDLSRGDDHRRLEVSQSQQPSAFRSGQFLEAVTFTDDTVLTAAVSAEYSAAAVARDNKGNVSNPPVTLQQGEIAPIQSNTIKSYRKYFWGAHTDFSTEISCDNIDTLLSSNSSKAAAAGDSFSIQIHRGDKRVAFAYPVSSGLGCTVQDVKNSYSEITDAFSESRISVGGFRRNDNKIEYRLFQTNINVAGDGALQNTYIVTFS